MNLPNKLTVLRIILTPVFLIFFITEGIPYRFIIALIIFSAASITDLLDGKIARKNNLITAFGKLTDPLADKMLTTAALLGLMQMGLCNIWILFIILFREFGVSSVRLVAAAQGVVIPANIWGKIKTVSQMLFIILIMLLLSLKYDFCLLPAAFPLSLLSNVLLWISAGLAALSGAIYLKGALKLIDFSK